MLLCTFFISEIRQEFFLLFCAVCSENSGNTKKNSKKRRKNTKMEKGRKLRNESETIIFLVFGLVLKTIFIDVRRLFVAFFGGKQLNVFFYYSLKRKVVLSGQSYLFNASLMLPSMGQASQPASEKKTHNSR